MFRPLHRLMIHHHPFIILHTTLIMTDAQQLIDYARDQFNQIAAEVEQHFDLVAGHLRDTFSRSLPPQLPARRVPPPTAWQTTQRWISRHRALTAAIVTFFVAGSVGSVVYLKSKDLRRKRRAKRSSSGARTEVVVVAGAVSNPLTSALYLDLERRGFMVYAVASSPEEEQYIRSQSRGDLVPLSLDLVDPYTVQNQLSRFQAVLAKEHLAFDGAEPHRLNLVGVILVPDTKSHPCRVEGISSEEWSDALNAKVLNTIATTQLLLPTVIEHKAKLLLLTPSTVPALRPPMHAIESTVYGALQGFTSSLSAELRQCGVRFSHLKIGDIDVPSLTAKQRREGVPAPKFRPTPLRHLQDAVFDTLVARKPQTTMYIGRGARTYAIIGSMAPPPFVAWMMGASKLAPDCKKLSDGDLSGSAGSLTWEKVDNEV